MTIFFVIILSTHLSSQVSVPKFGSGIQLMAKDSSMYMKVGFRFQTLLVNDWDADETGFSGLNGYESAFLIRRSRLKFDGWALTPKLKYKAELALSNRDNGGGGSLSEFNTAANIILDAFLEYRFYKGLSIRAGQFKLPGNRERVISSGNMQLVNRSRLNSRYTLDRDVGVMLINKHTVGESIVMKQLLAVSSGEGKNVTAGNIGGYGISARVEVLPFGDFQSKGDYIGSAIKYEETPKLALAFTYDTNANAGRERGQLGSFLSDDAILHTLNSYFIDLMFKYKGFAFMAEYADRKSSENSPIVYNDAGDQVGTYYMGSGLNLSAGYMFSSNWEVALRLTDMKPHADVAPDETQYTVGLSKFIVGHKLKIQTDLTLRDIKGGNNQVQQRVQFDIHF